MMKKFYGIFIMLVLVQLSFAQKVTVPQLSAPENEYEYCMPNVILDWVAVSGIGEISYHCQLATDGAFTNLIVDQDEISISAYFNENLLFGQTYFWRVKATDETGAITDWSAEYTFTVFSECELDKPRDGKDEIDIRPNFEWDDEAGDNKMAGFDGFELELDTSANFDSPLNHVYTSGYHEDDLLFGLTPDYLLFSGLYYWRVRPINSVSTGVWSEVFSFETIFGVELKDPDNNSTNIEFDEKFKWDDLDNGHEDYIDPDVFEYTIQFSFDEVFTDPTVMTVLDNEAYPDFLKFGREYFWRVRAAHTHDVSVWSDIESFSTIDAVELSFPADESVPITDRPILEWETFPAVDGYQIRFSKNADMTDADYFVVQGTDTDNYPLDPLDLDQDYYWSVRSFKSIDTSSWANNFTFNIPWNVGIENMTNVSNLAIYPNPATTTLSVQFVAQENIVMEMTISDILGKTVAEEVIEISTGNFQKTFDISELNSGIYFLEFQQGDQRNVIKFVVE